MGRLFKYGKKRWRVEYRVGYGRSAPKRSKVFDSKTEAAAYLLRVTAEQAAGQYVDPRAGRAPFGDYAQQWLDRRRVRPSTEETYASHLKKHIRPLIGDVPVKDLSRSHVDAFVAALERTLAPSTARGVFNTARMVARGAVRDRLLAVSPFDDVRAPEVPRLPVQVLTAAQLRALIAATREDQRAAVILAAGAGLRQGETLGATVGAVDWLRRTYSVSQQAVRGGLGPPKTPASVRTVPLPEFVVTVLAQHVEAYPPGGEGLLFRSTRGRLWRRDAFNEFVWKPALERAELDRTLGFHVLRHTYASLLIDAGQHPRVIMERLGHASIVETMNTYGHLFPHADEETRAVFEGVFTELGADRGRTVGGDSAGT